MAIPEEIITLKLEEFACPDEGKKYAGDYTITRWNAGLKTKVLDSAVEVEAGGTTRMKAGTYRFATLAACLTNAPFKTTPKNPNIAMLGQMPPFAFAKLYEIANKLTLGVTEKKRKN